MTKHNEPSIKIDHWFKSIIPPLTPDEYAQLEANIKAQGCRDPIKVWKGQIVDGHNRYQICTTHNIPYATYDMTFKSRLDATSWVIDNQLGRRNLPDAMRIKLAAHKIELQEGSPKRAKINRRKAIAKAAGVSEQNVRKYMQIRQATPRDLLSKIEKGEQKIGAAYKSLYVTQKVVEPLCTEEGMAAILAVQTPSYIDGLFANIDKLAGFYQDMQDNTIHIIKCDGVVKIKRWLGRHGRLCVG